MQPKAMAFLMFVALTASITSLAAEPTPDPRCGDGKDCDISPVPSPQAPATPGTRVLHNPETQRVQPDLALLWWLCSVHTFGSGLFVDVFGEVENIGSGLVSDDLSAAAIFYTAHGRKVFEDWALMEEPRPLRRGERNTFHVSGSIPGMAALRGGAQFEPGISTPATCQIRFVLMGQLEPNPNQYSERCLPETPPGLCGGNPLMAKRIPSTRHYCPSCERVFLNEAFDMFSDLPILVDGLFDLSIRFLAAGHASEAEDFCKRARDTLRQHPDSLKPDDPRQLLSCQAHDLREQVRALEPDVPELRRLFKHEQRKGSNVGTGHQ